MAKKNRLFSEEAASVPISSMIDIVFLLIIFFIVTATLDKDMQDESVLLADAPNGRPVVKQDPRTIIINLRMDGSMNIGGRPISADQLTALLEDVKRTTPDPMSIPIVIRGDRQVQYYYGMKVLDAIKKTGLYKVSLAGMQE